MPPRSGGTEAAGKAAVAHMEEVAPVERRLSLAESSVAPRVRAAPEPLRASDAKRWTVAGGTTGDDESVLVRDNVTNRSKVYRVGDFLPDGMGIQEIRRGQGGRSMGGGVSMSVVDMGGREGWIGRGEYEAEPAVADLPMMEEPVSDRQRWLDDEATASQRWRELRLHPSKLAAAMLSADQEWAGWQKPRSTPALDVAVRAASLPPSMSGYEADLFAELINGGMHDVDTD